MAQPDYTPIYQAAGQANNVDPVLLAAINQVESGGNPGAISSAGAQGNMQLMPATAQSLGVQNPNDPTQSIYGAARLISQNLNATNGNVPQAVAMYFAGPNRAEWGPQTHAYPVKVSQAYQQLKAAPMAQSPLTLDDLASSAQLSPGGTAQAGTQAPPAASSAPLTLDDIQASTVVPAAPISPGTPPQMSAEARAAHPVAADVLDAANAVAYNPVSQGIMRAVHGVTDVPSEALAGAVTATGIPQGLQDLMARVGVSPQTAQAIAPTGAQQAGADSAAASNWRQNYANNPVAQAANLGTQALLTLPALESGAGAIRAGGNALLRGAGDFATGNAAGNLLTRGASMAAGGALSGAGAAALTAGAGTEPMSRQIAAGAEGGALAGPVVGALGAGVNHVLGGAGIDPYVAQLAQKAVNLGIPLRAGQIATNPMVRVADDVVARIPGSGAGTQTAAQVEAFNGAIAREMGENATRITPALMQAVKSRAGGVMNDVAAKTNIVADAPLAQDLLNVHQGAHQALAPAEAAIIDNQLNNVGSQLTKTGGSIGGDAYQALTRTGSPLDRAMQSDNSNVRFYAGQIKDAVESAMQRSAPPALQQQLAQARYQYKVMKTIEPLIAKDSDGLISPQALMTPVAKEFGNIAYNGGGTMGDLARIGQQFLKAPANSNTADRAAIIGALTGGIPAVMGAAIHDPVGAAFGAGSMISAPIIGRAAHMALNNKAVRNALIARALGQTAPASVNALTAAAAQPTGNALLSATGQ